MSRLFETIKCEDGKLLNLEYHRERFNRSRKDCFGSDEKLLLEEIISIPEECKSGIFRCRVTYSDKIEKIEFLAYQFRNVESLKLVYDDNVDYHFKYSDRNYLTKLFEKRRKCDDILIVKNGCITDSYTANPIFFNGKNWWTPETVLLPGTQRAKLLKEGIIFKQRITPDDLYKYSKVGLVNALQPMETMPVIEIKNILK